MQMFALTVEVDVDTVKTDQEVGKDVLLGLGDVGEKGGNERFPVWERVVDGDQQLERLGVDIADLDTTFVSEENPVSLSGRVDTNVVLGVSRVRRERLDDEGVKGTSGGFDCHWLAGLGLDPSASLLPLLVEAKEARLSTSLDELIGLADELLGEDPFRESLTGADRRGELFCGRVAVVRIELH